MEEQYLFLNNEKCLSSLKTYQVSDLRSHLSQEDRARTMKRLENDTKVLYLNQINKEISTRMKYGRNPTLDECCQIFKIRKEKKERNLEEPKEYQIYRGITILQTFVQKIQ
jgi:hypothetical protein